MVGFESGFINSNVSAISTIPQTLMYKYFIQTVIKTSLNFISKQFSVTVDRLYSNKHIIILWITL